jgi:hypothetical protein
LAIVGEVAGTQGKGRRLLLGGAVLALLIAAPATAASTLPKPISSDTYTNTESWHKTQVEPDSFAWGNTIVAVTQTGRVSGGGASNIAWSTSQDAGRTWTTGVLPQTTVHEGGPWSFVSDPAVAFDPAHNVWMASSLAWGLASSPSGAPGAVLTSRSTDGGLTWQNPVTTVFTPDFIDKNWIACDTWAASPNYGHCYTEWDDNSLGNQLMMSTSTDGGLTWSPPASPTGTPSGLGGQPLALPDGTVVVPYSANDAAIGSFRSTDGGLTWTGVTNVANVTEHNVGGGLRTSPLPSAEVDASGKVYVVWQDCRFRTGCPQNDIVMSTSTDGLAWSAVTRIPIDATNSTVDHFIPGIAVDPATSGSTARLALGYYYYPVSTCTAATCQLTVGFISSADGGITWSTARKVSHAMNLSWLAPTSQGPMVGDYMSTSFAGGTAHPVFAIAKPKIGTAYREQLATATFPVGASIRSTPVDVSRRKVSARPRADFFPTRR